MLPSHKEVEARSGRQWSVVITHISLAESLMHRRCSVIIHGVNEIIIVLSCLGAETQFGK